MSPPPRGYGVYINYWDIDISFFRSLPAPAARAAVVGVALIILLTSLLSGVLIFDLMYAGNISTEALHRAMWRAVMGCLGIAATCGAVIYHYYSLNNGAIVSAEREADLEVAERSV
jgi:hypothetical protein